MNEINNRSILYLGNDLSRNSKYHSAYATLRYNLQKEGYKVKSASSKESQFLRLLDMIFSVVRNAKGVDYILIDTFSTNAFYFAFLTSQLARMFNIKYIPILHGGDLPKRLDNSSKLSKMIFKHSYVNISPSKYLFEEFEKRGYTNLNLIPNSINIGDYKFKQRTEVGPNLLYVRAFAEIYNPLLAIKVLNKLKEDYSEAKLCMVGPDRDGTLKLVEQKIEDLNLKKDVKITGVLPKEEWHQLSEKYDIFINTTNVDNTPVSLIETMALGLPIVSTNVGGIPYLVEDNTDAMLVEPNNISEMVNAIKELISNDKKVYSLSSKGRKKAEKMDWNEVKYQWFKVLA
ncbi:glycosyltransferase family 4 protein [Wenyingzhuangia sp. IMCC45533]